LLLVFSGNFPQKLLPKANKQCPQEGNLRLTTPEWSGSVEYTLASKAAHGACIICKKFDFFSGKSRLPPALWILPEIFHTEVSLANFLTEITEEHGERKGEWGVGD
jgi:hypothetical protein